MRILQGLLFAAVLAFAGPVTAAQVSGSARVIDGDTLAIGAVVVRLHGIDAPESDQHCTDGSGRDFRCGDVATETLLRLVGDHKVSCVGNERDRYGRLIAVCLAGATDLDGAMVRSGWALAFVRYSRDYVAEQSEAERSRRGLWAGTFNAPWDHRAAGRTAAAAPASVSGCRIKGNISSSGHIYHLPGSLDYDRTVITPSRGERWFCSEAEAIAAGWRARRQ